MKIGNNVVPRKVSSTEITKASSEVNSNRNPNNNNNLDLDKLETKNDNIKKDELQKKINSINKFIEPAHTSIKFELHDKLDEYYVTIIDDITKEVVKEIPPKKFLDMYASMMEFMGLLVDYKI